MLADMHCPVLVVVIVDVVLTRTLVVKIAPDSSALSAATARGD